MHIPNRHLLAVFVGFSKIVPRLVWNKPGVAANLEGTRAHRLHLVALLIALYFSWRCAAGPTAPEASDKRGNAAQSHQLADELSRKEYKLKKLEFIVTCIGLGGTVMALGLGVIQYRKSERWKRVEFLASEMKEFLDDKEVRNVLTMIDWAPRRINLFHVENLDPATYPIVTRILQIAALQPHTFLRSDGGSDGQADGASESAGAEGKSKFNPDEVRIRDAYDRFLDYLERFGSQVKTQLVSKKELAPYLGYWIKDIAAVAKDPDDAEWTCALFAYIEFYGFVMVRALFEAYGYDISTKGELFEKNATVATDREWARRLREACRELESG